MTLKKIYLPEQSYFITTNVLNREWIFGSLKNGLYLPHDGLCKALINILNTLRGILGFLLHGYVIMPHHLHLILNTAAPFRVGENSFSLSSLAEDKSSATRSGGNTNSESNTYSEGNTYSTRPELTMLFNDRSASHHDRSAFLHVSEAEDKSSATRLDGNANLPRMGEDLSSSLAAAKNKFLATRVKNNSNRTTHFKNKTNQNRVGEDLSSPSTNVSQIMKLIKGRSARILNNLLGRSGQLWQHSFYEHCIRNEKDFMEKLNYIHFNPIKANLVQDPLNFQYSSYRNYYSNDDSIIKIDKFDL